jgi:hypothetical protein
MTARRVHPAATDLVVTTTSPPPSPPPEVLERLDAVWEQERTARPSLFDGPLFARTAWHRDETGRVVRIEGGFVPYRWYIARTRDEHVARALDVWFMGVSGVLQCPDGLVVGRRSRTTTDGGLLELVPAGSLDDATEADGTLDVRRQVLRELAEELGLARAHLTADPQPFTVVEDAGVQVADVGLLLHTDLSADALVEAHRTHAGDEYDDIRVMSAAELAAADDVASTTLLLLEALAELRD